MYDCNELPVIVAYARSGNHWIQALLEAYFNKKRYNVSEVAFCDNFDEYLFYGTHDLECKEDLSNRRILYLYRHPINVIFSYYMAEIKKNHGDSIENFIDKICFRLLNHYQKYLLSDICEYKVQYAALKFNFLEEFTKIVNFLGEEIDVNRAMEINKKMNKTYVINKIIECSSSGIGSEYINSHMLTERYELLRFFFIEKYGRYIKKRMLFSKEVRSYFKNFLTMENLCQ